MEKGTYNASRLAAEWEILVRRKARGDNSPFDISLFIIFQTRRLVSLAIISQNLSLTWRKPVVRRSTFCPRFNHQPIFTIHPPFAHSSHPSLWPTREKSKSWEKKRFSRSCSAAAHNQTYSSERFRSTIESECCYLLRTAHAVWHYQHHQTHSLRLVNRNKATSLLRGEILAYVFYYLRVAGRMEIIGRERTYGEAKCGHIATPAHERGETVAGHSARNKFRKIQSTRVNGSSTKKLEHQYFL